MVANKIYQTNTNDRTPILFVFRFLQSLAQDNSWVIRKQSLNNFKTNFVAFPTETKLFQVDFYQINSFIWSHKNSTILFPVCNLKKKSFNMPVEKGQWIRSYTNKNIAKP